MTEAPTKRMSAERLAQNQLDHLANVVAGHCVPSESDMHTNLRMALDHIAAVEAELEAARGAALEKMLAEAFLAGWRSGDDHEDGATYAARTIEQMKEQP